MPSQLFFNLPQDKQEGMMNTALKMFSQYTYDEVNVRKILRESGLSTGSFYRYFGSKDELYIYAVDFALKRFRLEREELEKELGHPVSMEEMLEHSHLHRRFWTKFNQSSMDIRKKYYFRTKENLLFDIFLAEIKKLDTKTDYPPTEQGIMAFVLNVLQYIIVEYKQLNELSFDEEDMFQIFKRILLHGYENYQSKE